MKSKKGAVNFCAFRFYRSRFFVKVGRIRIAKTENCGSTAPSLELLSNSKPPCYKQQRGDRTEFPTDMKLNNFHLLIGLKKYFPF